MAKASKACAFLRRCPSLTLGSMLEEIAAILPGHEFSSMSDIQFCCQTWLMQMTTTLLLKLRFKEQIGDVLAARATYIQQTGKESDSDFVQNVISRANMEKRLGNMESACGIYKEAIEMVVAEENLQHALPNLYVHFSHLKYMMFVWDACKDLTLIILMVAAAASLVLGIKSEGIKEGWYDGRSMAFAVILVIVVTATSDYKQSLQFRDLNEEKRNIHLE
ncbi:calcium-transporting ATPase 9, plasma membrane-type-like isoform X2 [Arachis stenosperma]|nr:calcium-transporting ATPase 9, plasma membrane-type-like isoform X2 [Arachis stenosperma]